MAAADPGVASSTALLTDQYELTMVDAALRSGVAAHPTVFEVWTRSLPEGRRFGVVAGTGRLVEAIQEFRFGRAELDFLAGRGIVDEATLDWLASFRFSGDVEGYAEGELFFGGSPVLTVTAPFAEAVLLETLVLSVLNHDCAVASAAARMVAAAAPHVALIEMGGRRTHEQAAVAAARAAYVAGFTSTSNLEAGRTHGMPTAGTVAHAFILAHDDELTAFVAQLQTLGPATTLLVDTYDVEQGLRNAVEAAHRVGAAGPGAVRIDAGDLVVVTRRARTLLDELGATRTRIVASGDLDEHVIAALEQAPGGRAPIDAYGVGTRLVTGSGHPTAGFIYKLVAVAEAVPSPASPDQRPKWRPVHKTQQGKATVGGRKQALRLIDASGRAEREVLVATSPGSRGTPAMPAPGSSSGAQGRFRGLQVPLIRGGRSEPSPSLAEVRQLHREVLTELPDEACSITAGRPAIPVELAAE